jgi:NADPH-dependent ferric siderophore reductase
MTIIADDGFRFMTVVASHRIAPRMQRLRLAGEDLARFDTFANLHVRLYISNDPCKQLPRPMLGADSRPRLSGRDDGCAMRYYTIRDINAEAGWLDIDFVLHENAGPACDFARRAQPGDICGISGPCGLSVKPAQHYLLAGDETALPAIARIARSLPHTAMGLIVIATHASNEQIDFPVPAGMTLQWVSTHSRLGQEKFVPSVSRNITGVTSASDDHFIWIAGEFFDCTALRPSLGKVHKSRHINVPYWRASPSPEVQR